jgi:hypothetical protein
MKTLRPHHRTKKEIRRRKRKFVISIIFIISFLVFFVWFMNQEKFKISEIKISGNKTILTQDIKKDVQKNISEKILWLLPRDNVILLNTKNVQQDIENSFPKIYHVKASIEKGSILDIDIEEREPHSLWCKDQEYEKTFDEECYFADQRGYLYARAPYFSHGIFRKIYTTEEILKIGNHVMGKDDFIEFFRFIDSLFKNYEISISKIFINEQHEVKLYLESLTKKMFFYNPYIIYKDTEPYKIVGRNIGLMLSHKLFKDEFKKHSERLKFIDLRIDDQIRFKFYTDEELEKLQKEKEQNEKTRETKE